MSLTDEKDWDYKYAATEQRRPRGRLPDKYFGSYTDFLYWSLVRKHLPHRPGLAVLEIGAAPGRDLEIFRQRFGCVTHGVDFSRPGVDRTRENFSLWGNDPENIVCADFFDAKYQSAIAGKFDVVLSRGLAEHFWDLPAVIRAHVAALRPGGLLLVSIPNFRSVNYLLARMLMPELIGIHNLGIMKMKKFLKGFDSPDLRILESRYLGVFDLGLFDTGRQTMVRKALRILQAGLNLLYRIVPLPETRWTSPQLICIAIKTGGEPAL